jgi:hypothetical protein
MSLTSWSRRRRLARIAGQRLDLGRPEIAAVQPRPASVTCSSRSPRGRCRARASGGESTAVGPGVLRAQRICWGSPEVERLAGHWCIDGLDAGGGAPRRPCPFPKAQLGSKVIDLAVTRSGDDAAPAQIHYRKRLLVPVGPRLRSELGQKQLERAQRRFHSTVALPRKTLLVLGQTEPRQTHRFRLSQIDLGLNLRRLLRRLRLGPNRPGSLHWLTGEMTIGLCSRGIPS